MVDNTEDILDSRDVIERIAELEAQDDLDEDESAELVVLRAFADEGESIDAWTHGVTLVRDSYFEEYARDLASDLGVIHERNQWPATCIDWERAASELQQDYTPIDFDGVTYWGR